MAYSSGRYRAVPEQKEKNWFVAKVLSQRILEKAPVVVYLEESRKDK